MANKPARKARISQVPKDETKEQRFVRLATKRVKKVLKALDQIGLLGAAAYTSTEKQRDTISETLRESIEFNLNRLNKSKTTTTNFTL